MPVCVLFSSPTHQLTNTHSHTHTLLILMIPWGSQVMKYTGTSCQQHRQPLPSNPSGLDDLACSSPGPVDLASSSPGPDELFARWGIVLMYGKGHLDYSEVDVFLGESVLRKRCTLGRHVQGGERLGDDTDAGWLGIRCYGLRG